METLLQAHPWGVHAVVLMATALQTASSIGLCMVAVEVPVLLIATNDAAAPQTTVVPKTKTTFPVEDRIDPEAWERLKRQL